MLLADEVGLGKTIEAGLILKELAARDLVQRVPVVVPASLQYQWHHELSSKFNEEFQIIDGAGVRFLAKGGRNPWTYYDRVICSLNLASSPKHAEAITAVDWDLVIFDEAHRVRRTLQGGRKVQITRAYSLADELKETANGSPHHDCEGPRNHPRTGAGCGSPPAWYSELYGSVFAYAARCLLFGAGGLHATRCPRTARP
jgi:SNF2 family DNA or RNA helicase